MKRKGKGKGLQADSNQSRSEQAVVSHDQGRLQQTPPIGRQPQEVIQQQLQRPVPETQQQRTTQAGLLVQGSVSHGGAEHVQKSIQPQEGPKQSGLTFKPEHQKREGRSPSETFQPQQRPKPRGPTSESKHQKQGPTQEGSSSGASQPRQGPNQPGPASDTKHQKQGRKQNRPSSERLQPEQDLKQPVRTTGPLNLEYGQVSQPTPKPPQPASKPPQQESASKQHEEVRPKQLETLMSSGVPTGSQFQPTEGGGKKKKPPKSKQETPKTTPEAGGDSTPTKAITKELVKTAPKYSIPTVSKPIVHVPNKVEKKVKIEVNYLQITIKDWNLPIYHYDVTFNPDKTKSLFRPALNKLLKQRCPNRHPAFDGRKNLYAGRQMLDFGTSFRESVKIHDVERQQDVEYDITIKLTDHGLLNLNQLKSYMVRGQSTDIPQDVIQACDIALRSGFYNRFVPVGRSFFSRPAGVPLEGGMELWDGFYQSKIAAWNPYLNVDVANKAFPIEQSVIEYIRTIRNFYEDELVRGLQQTTLSQLQKYIKGLKVLYMGNDERSKRTYRVNGLGQIPIKHEFQLTDGKKTNVLNYFRDVKRIPIRYPALPLLHVGPVQKGIMVPLEYCTIVGNHPVMRKLDERQTACMVRACATSTIDRKRRIMDNIRHAGYNADGSLMKEFGISVGDRFTTVDSTIFKPPIIKYRDNDQAYVRNGVWRMDNCRFIRGADQRDGLENWAVLIKDDRTAAQDVKNMIKLFRFCGEKMGLIINEPHMLSDVNRNTQTEQGIINNLKDLTDRYNKLQIVVVVMSNRSDAYNCIKRASELKTGVLTQCLKSVTVTNRKMNPMTATNILLKVNAKVNGINHGLAGELRPSVMKEPIMFVGADVTHPAPGADGVVSIAAVAASFDPSAFRYKMSYLLQPPKLEMIRDLEETMIKHLDHFQKQNNCLPKRIMYYRDGVSEGQFTHVLGIELTSLKQACVRIKPGYNPGITFLVVQKRHHTRFFPDKNVGDGSRNNNVLAGTVVDSLITHPTELDFYLVSHQSIQGTARPTKYHVLYDDNKFEADDLELLTYYLCYMFSRCNRSVSYPAPTYYAHLGAERARAYWDGQRMELADLRKQQQKDGVIHANITDMFFV